VTLPSQSAAYLNNPPPSYPAISKRLGEQGRVVVRVLIDEKGLPQQAELQTSSGHARLDQAALNAVMSWHYVPGRKAGRAQAMWFNVPITFDLKPARDG
jgi:protein TonB